MPPPAERGDEGIVIAHRARNRYLTENLKKKKSELEETQKERDGLKAKLEKTQKELEEVKEELEETQKELEAVKEELEEETRDVLTPLGRSIEIGGGGRTRGVKKRKSKKIKSKKRRKSKKRN